MGNCLVTKLKANVDNAMLPKLGGIVLRNLKKNVEPSKENHSLVIHTTQPFSVKIKNPTSADFFVNDRVSPAQNFTEIAIDGTVEDFNFMSSDSDFYLEVNSNYSITYISGTGCMVNLDDLKYYNLEEISSTYSVIGNIESLAYSTNLARVFIGNNQILYTDIDTRLYGDMVKLVYGQIKNGRRENSTGISFVYPNVNGGEITFNGVIATNFEENARLSWVVNPNDATLTDITYLDRSATIDANGNVVSL